MIFLSSITTHYHCNDFLKHKIHLSNLVCPRADTVSASEISEMKWKWNKVSWKVARGRFHILSLRVSFTKGSISHGEDYELTTCCSFSVEQCNFIYTGCFFTQGLPLKVQSTKKLIWARLGVSRTLYVNVDSPNLGFPYFNYSGGTSEKNTLYFTAMQPRLFL